ncbi:MAG: biotin--[acetyl-CoA-carboxylase] ligase [Isosphaeraceae bacterium]|nr:biotin--[acetyl-CoA-carboxylase] ligase [Isosphaeraceae bacterium]
MNIPLLQRLRAAQGAFVPLVELGGDLDAVRADLGALEAFGFRLEHHPYFGVAYRGPAERLCPDQIEWNLGTSRIGRRIAVWNRVSSTNDLAARASGSAANDGLVILAESQTAGRGRRGRTWTAPPASSILMSVLLFPPRDLDDPAWLTALGAIAAAEVVEAWTGREARIKWPNDVRVDGRKIAGVLVERGAGAVIGIGLNVNLALSDLPEGLRHSATSLLALRGEPADRSEVARALILRLDEHYVRSLAVGPEALAQPWRSRLEILGQTARLLTRNGSLVGRLVDADLQGGLILEPFGEPRRRVAAAEVLEAVIEGGADHGSPGLA